MHGISRREFAKRDGCSESLVRRGIKQGRLSAFPDGSIDPALAGTPWRRSAHTPAHSAADTAHTAHTSTHDADAAPNAAIPELGDDSSFVEAQRVKEIYLAKKRKLEFEAMAGQLVERAAVDRDMYRLSRAERDALTGWPSRVAAEIAALFQIDPIKFEIELEKRVRQFLTERSDPRLHLKN